MKVNKLGANSILLGINLALVVAGLYLAFMWAPEAADFKAPAAQRIFYFHVPTFAASAVSYVVVLIGSVLYLWKRKQRWDHLAYSAAEVGVVFTTLTLLTGSIWGKAEWQTWWTWEPRLTTVLVMWLIYVGYLLVRSYAQPTQGPNFASVVGIVGFVDVIIVFFAIRWWRTTAHPEAILETGGIDPSMLAVMLVGVGALVSLAVVLLRIRLQQRLAEGEIDELRAQLGR